MKLSKRNAKSAGRKGFAALTMEPLESRCVLNAGSITGAVYVDTSNDGVLDPQEVGLPGVQVTLWGVEINGSRVTASQTTDAIGRYQFENLNAGVYVISETQPDEYFDGEEQIGSAGGATRNDRFFLRLNRDQHATDYYFAELAPASLRGFVYLDNDRDGNLDPFDDALSDITVTLDGQNDLGDKVKEKTTTQADGSYIFAGLRPGTYEIAADQTKAYADGRETLGTFVGNPNPIGRNGTMTNDTFSEIQILMGEEGYNYNFGELDETNVDGILATTFDVAIDYTGTPDVDTFDFIAGETEHTVILNGESFPVDASQTTLITFYAQGGDDIVHLTGLSSKDEIELRDTSAKFTGVSYRVIVYSAPFITAQSGGGQDRAMFYDTAGDERFEANPIEGRIYGDGFEHSAHAFHRAYAYASDGLDVAVFRDSAGNDAFKATPTDARMSGNGFYNYAKGFDRADAFAEAGGTNDRAYFYDSAGADTLEAHPTEVRLYGTAYDNRAHAFERTYAFASGGGDTASFYDTVGSDYFKVDQHGARMYGTGYYNRAVGFDANFAYFTEYGATDRALVVTSSGSDSLTASGDVAELTRAGQTFTIELVDKMKAISGLGPAQADIQAINFALELEGDWTTV